MANMERSNRKIVDVFIDSDTDSDSESHTGSEGAGGEEDGESALDVGGIQSLVEGGIQPSLDLQEESDSEMEYEEPGYRASPAKSK